MRLLLLLVATCSFFFTKGQELGKSSWIVGPSVAYQYQSNNFVKLSFWGLTDLGYADYLKIDAGADFTCSNKKMHVIPELGLTYYLNSRLIWPFIKAEVTPYTISPKVGLGIFNIIELGLGYGWSLKDKKELGPIKGFNFSLGLSLPLNYTL